MDSSTSKGIKRKRGNGAGMAHLREAVDNETGEVYRVETTRQAKRRHQRSGAGQYRPTIGQLNAADIWNKQEERIKKDKAREEKRKKDKIKQAAKDARQREAQQELLLKGHITVEDTWGKVSASQNRLHQFFGPPQKRDSPTEETSEQDPDDVGDKNSHVHANDENEYTRGNQTEDLEAFFRSSPVSPVAEKSPMLKTSSASRTMMPPPPPRLSGVSAQKSPHRAPLGEMTRSEVNIRASERPNPDEEAKCQAAFFPVSTQVIHDTLAGLCSQDFSDNFAEDLAGGEKENKSPFSSFKNSGSSNNAGNSPSKECCNRNVRRHQYTVGDVDQDRLSDDFDDEGIDDESLLSLAATQQLKKDLFHSPTRDLKSDFPREVKSLNTAATPVSASGSNVVPKNRSPHLSRTQKDVGPLYGPAEDSFAMEDLNDDDLLDGLDEYEHDTDGLDDEDVSHLVQRSEKSEKRTGDDSVDQPRPSKKRRVLPWDRDPIQDLSAQVKDADGVRD